VYRLLFFSLAVACLGGCDTGSVQSSHSEAILVLTESPDNPESLVIPVGPAVNPDSVNSTVLSADVRSVGGSVAIRRIVVQMQASVPVDSILTDATLLVADRRISLSRTVSVGSNSSHLEFNLPQDNQLVVSKQQVNMRLTTKFNRYADGVSVQAGFSKSAKAKMRLADTQASLELVVKEPAGRVASHKHSLRKAGLHVSMLDATAEEDNDMAAFKVRLDVTAFATDTVVNFRPRRQIDDPLQSRGGGFYFAIQEAGSLEAGGGATTSLQTVTTAEPISKEPANTITIKEGEKQTVTLFVRYKPPTAASRYCLRTGTVRYKTNHSDGLITTDRSIQPGCVQM
jgi:hypothetical protein